MNVALFVFVNATWRGLSFKVSCIVRRCRPKCLLPSLLLLTRLLIEGADVISEMVNSCEVLHRELIVVRLSKVHRVHFGGTCFGRLADQMNRLFFIRHCSCSCSNPGRQTVKNTRTFLGLSCGVVAVFSSVEIGAGVSTQAWRHVQGINWL